MNPNAYETPEKKKKKKEKPHQFLIDVNANFNYLSHTRQKNL